MEVGDGDETRDKEMENIVRVARIVERKPEFI
jgi:hypothetical protein